MARTVSIPDEQILAAARSVFLDKGIRATTGEVARRARVAEGSLFRRFKTKDLLFLAAMRPALKDPEWVKTLATHAGEGDLTATLQTAGRQAISFFRQVLPLMMMTWSNQSCAGGLPAHLVAADSPPLKALKALVRYFEAEMSAGNLRRQNPEIPARVFAGSMQNYVFFELLLRHRRQRPLPDKEYVRGVVRVLLHGAATERARKVPR